MTDLNANVSASQEWLPLTDADSRSLADGYYTIDTENVKVENGPHPATSLSITPYNGRRAVRGVGGSTAASHLSGATLTRYYPDAASGGGGGGVTVDNTVDPPVLVESIVAAGATFAGAEATLAGLANPMTEAFVIATTDDPDPNSSLGLQAVAGQVGPLIVAKDSEDVELFHLGATGETIFRVPTGSAFRVYATAGGGPLAIIGESEVVLTTDVDGVGPKLAADVNGLAYTDAAGVAQFGVDATGIAWIGVLVSWLASGQTLLISSAAPAGADIGAGQLAFYYDDTNGAAKFKLVGKSANGTVVSGEIALT